MADFWYRAEIKHYSVADEWGDHSYTSTEISWTKYAVVRETPKGVWLNSGAFVLGKATKQLACPTKELALEDCRQRKLAHIRGCKARLARAERDLEVINGEGCLLSLPLPRSA